MITERVEIARRYAKTAHANQLYGDEFPYVIHLATAHAVAVQFGLTDEDLLCAVWTHDVIEDTGRDLEEFTSVMGPVVADIVSRLSEPGGLPRKERHAFSYPRIRDSQAARLVKLCDRISHVMFGGKKVKMYLKEHAEFKAALMPTWAVPPEAGINLTEYRMWRYLDSLLAEVV